MKTERNAPHTSPLRLLTSLLLLAGATLGGTAHAADAYPPQRLTYQGFLTDANGVPLATNAPKNYDVIFKVWAEENNGTAPMWTELQSVTVDNGLFNVLLGEGAAVGTNAHGALSTLFVGANASDRYVETTVKGVGSSGEDVTLAPRLRLLASPYSFTARNAHNLVSDNGLTLVTANGANSIAIQGTVSATNFSGGHSGNGSAITNLNANNLATGSIPDARLSANVPFKNVVNTFSANQLFSGNVGMGSSTTPGFPLTFGSVLGDKISLWGQTAGNSYGFGIQGSLLQIHSDSSGSDVAFGYGSSASMTETMRIKGNGNVGIGTASPTQAKLVVHGGPSGSAAGDNGFYYANPILSSWYYGQYVNTFGGGAGADVTTTYITLPNYPFYYGKDVFVGQCSIYADKSIWSGTQLITSSDERIKNVVGQSDSVLDLNTLLGIEVSDYRFKDVAGNGNGLHKKVIAQQVEKVFPQAVSQQLGVIPDIYKQAPIKDGWVKLSTDLKKGDRVKLLGGKGEEGVHEVLAVSMDSFRTDFKTEEKSVFVYGREVKDFRTVDYDAIAMLNVSATQELAKEVAALHKSQGRVTELELKLSKLEDLEKQVARMGDLERELADLKKMVGQLVSPQHAEPGAVTEPSESTTQAPR